MIVHCQRLTCANKGTIPLHYMGIAEKLSRSEVKGQGHVYKCMNAVMVEGIRGVEVSLVSHKS